MAIKYAINGFGRIGRNIVRAARGSSHAELVAVNDLTDAATLGHLLKYDSVHGRYDGEVSVDGDSITVDGDRLKVLSERDPANLPWKELGADVILESTGIFASRDKASIVTFTTGTKQLVVHDALEMT